MIETLIPVPGRFKPYETGTPLANAADIRDESNNKRVLETLDYINDRAIVCYGPYLSVAEAHSALNRKGFNTVGTTVGVVDNNGSITEYWYKSGTQLANLVKKDSSVKREIQVNGVSILPPASSVAINFVDGENTHLTYSGNSIMVNATTSSSSYQDVYWIDGGDTLWKNDNGTRTSIVTATQILNAANGVTQEQFNSLQQQINQLAARLTGVTITVSPTNAVVGQQTTFAIGVDTITPADAIVIYRGETEIYSSNTPGISWSYSDTFTPSVAGTFKYRVVATIGNVTKENEITISVGKRSAGIQWSYNNVTAYTGYSGNQFPTLTNPNNLTITYESSNTSVATINSSGIVTLVGAGTTEIRAVFAGNNTYTASTVQYNLSVVQDLVNSLSWGGGSLSPVILQPGANATLTKGTVIATYLSGKTEDVTSNAVFSAQRGSLNGVTYTAPNTSGNDTISVSYAGKTSSTKINITITEEPRFTVQFGHGVDYANASFTDTGETLHNNMSVTTNRNAGDYLFIKVDKRDTVNNLYLHNEGGGIFEYMEISLGTAVTSGDYKYYQSVNQYNAGTGVEYVINKV